MKSYPAVAVITGSNCCPAVKLLKGTKKLAAAMPSLPLPDCTMRRECQCRFKKYADRRSEDEDRRMFGASERSVWYSGEQRRKSPTRRTRK
jgi:hypothetical protein